MDQPGVADVATLPDKITAIKDCGYVRLANRGRTPEMLARFGAGRIPVVGIRHVRQWGLQVDDERVLPGLERTSVADEELWEVNLTATDGSRYEVNADLVEPAPQ
jgi:hypothetical protein